MAEGGDQQETNRRACAFCGSTATLTREHVFGDWLSKIGLGDEPSEFVTGSLNQIGKKLGPTRPFQTKVKNVCAGCNHGWMSRLEQVAQQALTPMLLGGPGRIEPSDQAAIAAWVQKTIFISMYVSSAEARANGHGIAPDEYALLYQQRDRAEPTPNSKFWVSSYSGAFSQGATWATPIVMRIDGYPEPDYAQGYAMTLAVGALLFHGVRFTNLPFGKSVSATAPLVQMWPVSGDVALPTDSISHDDFLSYAQGRRLALPDEGLSLRPLSSAINSADSELAGTTVEMPTPCGKGHFVRYPMAFAQNGMSGRFLWFQGSCACGVTYLVHIQRDGAHVRAAGEPEAIEERFANLAGLVRMWDGVAYKRDLE